ncbi:hypothetical protein [Kribbella sp. NPDC051770]|uniref:hypothetical protein n=1 Tax=Kribbella sp. NPDC051770 TaxID=3155413 RepID=UPI003422D823
MKVIFVALGAVLLVAGCGSNDDAGTPAADAPTISSTPTPTATPTPTPTPTPAPKPKPKPKPLPKAKDGKNLAACRDGDCQVQIGPGRTTFKFQGIVLAIDVANGVATFDLDGDIRGGSGELVPGFPQSFGDMMVLGGDTYPRSEDPPGLTMRAPYVAANGAVIDLHLLPGNR